MAVRFEGHGLADGLVQAFSVTRVGTQHLLEVGGMFIAQAQQQPPFDGQPHTVAGAAEIVAVGRNEADTDVRCFGQAPVTRRALGRFGRFEQGEVLGDTRTHLVA
ncbi:hypothetical protein D3C76_1357950 [compost metagenome]